MSQLFLVVSYSLNTLIRLPHPLNTKQRQWKHQPNNEAIVTMISDFRGQHKTEKRIRLAV